MAKTIHSGAAKGSDTLFSILGNKKGFKVKHHVFQEQKMQKEAIETGEIIVHSEDELKSNKELFENARRHLGREKPKNDYIRKLLLRNAFQVINSNLVVGISKINNFKKCHVAGGTGYAVAMAYLSKIPILLFDQERNNWFYSLKGYRFEKLGNRPNIEKFPAHFAGIGTRELKDNAEEELKIIFNQ